MEKSLKIFLVAIVLIYIFLISIAVKKKKMRINYLIVWMITGFALIMALVLPNFIEMISNLIGFELVINMIFCFAIFLIFYLLFNLTKLITKEQNRNILLIQEISILKKRVEELENQKK